MNASLFIRKTVVTLAVSLLVVHCRDANTSPDMAGVKPDANQPSSNENMGDVVSGAADFIRASRVATPAVVHIKTLYGSADASPLEQLYGRRSQGAAMGSGSGVIIGEDGYIATNNHVIENASQIEVIFSDRRSFPAKLIGRDPNTDLALLKVDARELPVLKFGNSDNVQVGEWVLAVGYPLSLNTTVTAGIISAKGRSIGIINRPGGGFRQGGEQAVGNTAIESFLQTDAAINPGNSGGALVNTNGQLIGINTAIASQTGSYAGYAFAIPVNLASKILEDLKKFGSVKRGILGVSFPSPAVEDQYLKQEGINPAAVKGVYITDVQQGSAAAEAGLKEGDVIQSIDDVTINSSAEFSERIARHRPKDKIAITYLRNGKTGSTTVTLKGEESKTLAGGGASLREIYDRLGASFAPLTPGIRERFDLDAGVVVTEVYEGGFFDQLGIPAGTIIVYINGKAVYRPQDIEAALIEGANGVIQILAVAPDGSRVAFNFSLGA